MAFAGIESSHQLYQSRLIRLSCAEIEPGQSMPGVPATLMMGTLKDGAESDFVERFGLMFERLGGNRSHGRALAWLTICEPPERSAAEIRDALQISQANVSTTMRALAGTGLVERISIPGKRPVHYRVPVGAWENTADRRLQETNDFVALAEFGKKVVAERPAASRRRIKEMAEWAKWWRNRYAQMLEEWRRR